MIFLPFEPFEDEAVSFFFGDFGFDVRAEADTAGVAVFFELALESGNVGGSDVFTPQSQVRHVQRDP
jgi:hypothetical protein